MREIEDYLSSQGITPIRENDLSEILTQRGATRAQRDEIDRIFESGKSTLEFYFTLGKVIGGMPYVDWGLARCNYQRELWVLSELDKIVGDVAIGSAVDLGCGTGLELCYLAQKYPEKTFTGVDFARTMIQAAKSRAVNLRLKNIVFYQQDIRKLKFIDPPYDLAISNSCFVNEREIDSDIALEKAIDSFFAAVERVSSGRLVMFGSPSSHEEIIDEEIIETDENNIFKFLFHRVKELDGKTTIYSRELFIPRKLQLG